MRVGVIGAGPAGITAAYELAKRGVEVDVFEASDAAAGMARTIELWGQRVDLGPHRFFSRDIRVNRVWLEVVGDDYRMVDRLTRIYYRNKFFRYPLQGIDALKKMGAVDAVRCFASYACEKLRSVRGRNVPNETFESWVVSRFGRRLFEMFFKSYSEKLWGIRCDQLDADFAAQRIKDFSLGEAVKATLGWGKSKHKTLVDRFAYPLEGSGVVYERMANRVRGHGGRVHLNCPVQRVLHQGNRVNGLQLSDGRRFTFDHVISTMPLTLLVRGLQDVPTEITSAIESLQFRNTVLVYLHLDCPDLFSDQWLYVHSPEVQTGRITNFRNWVPELYGDKSTTILSFEYWCYDQDSLWSEPDQCLVGRAAHELWSTGLSRRTRVLDGCVHRIRRCYPVYASGYRRQLDKVEKYLDSFLGLTAIGRYGAFKYNNQDHSILMGILAAENLVDSPVVKLWDVNTDYRYQEDSLISETGLQKAA